MGGALPAEYSEHLFDTCLLLIRINIMILVPLSVRYEIVMNRSGHAARMCEHYLTLHLLYLSGVRLRESSLSWQVSDRGDRGGHHAHRSVSSVLRSATCQRILIPVRARERPRCCRYAQFAGDRCSRRLSLLAKRPSHSLERYMLVSNRESIGS